MWVVAWVGVMGLWTGACSDPLHHGLDEQEANAMVVALNERGIAADKIVDPTDPERWAVEVANDRRVEAWSTLQKEGYPRPEQGGFDDFYPGGGLIPTAKEERVILQYATARELQSSLLRVEGVVDAHVHLVLPDEPRVKMSDQEDSKPRASVLIQWQERLGEPPLRAEAIRDLISGAVEDLEPEQVRVVKNRVSTPEPQTDEAELVRVGPLVVAPESQRPLKVLILFMGGVIILLSSGLAMLVVRRFRDGDEGGAR